MMTRARRQAIGILDEIIAALRAGDVQQVGKLIPLPVLARMHHLASLFLKPFEDENFGLQLLDGLCGGGLVYNRFLEILVFIRGHGLVGFPNILGLPIAAPARSILGHGFSHHLPTLAQLFILDPAGQPLALGPRSCTARWTH